MKKRGEVHVGIRVPSELAAAFGKVAAQEDRTVSQEVRRLMRQRVEARNDERPAEIEPSVFRTSLATGARDAT